LYYSTNNEGSFLWDGVGINETSYSLLYGHQRTHVGITRWLQVPVQWITYPTFFYAYNFSLPFLRQHLRQE